ncbi:hypothetical protein ILYODFUR_000126 [Ilyodon furcidens]|uniref:Uncharacterized protein n=1 Tax=Ilyodon furcidens TaxID=33524 RepID=A0ABV0SJ27_9TELE
MLHVASEPIVVSRLTSVPCVRQTERRAPGETKAAERARSGGSTEQSRESLVYNSKGNPNLGFQPRFSLTRRRMETRRRQGKKGYQQLDKLRVRSLLTNRHP